MPFCRKCGRRLVEYSESCPDCGTSTTAPLINIKRSQSSRQPQASREANSVKTFTPQVVQIQIKAPAQTVATTKKVTPAKVSPPKASDEYTTFVPATPTRPIEQPKPVLSAKHIIKPKKAKATRLAAAFTFTNARPIAGLQTPKSRFVEPKPLPQPKAYVFAESVSQPKAAAEVETVVPPILFVQQPEPLVATIKTVVTPIIAAEPKPTFSPSAPVTPPKPIIPAPVYPPHEIIKSNVSLKEDMLTNPQDYETQAFPFDLICPEEHFWPEGKALPVSKGKAYCPKCGERLSKPKPKKKYRRRYRRL